MRTSVDVHNFLLERDVPHELVPVRGRLRSPSRIAAVLGLPSDHVGRVVLFDGGPGLVAVMIPSDLDPDPVRVARAAGAPSVEAIPAERATDLTDFLHGALPPVALPSGTAAVMDEALERQEVLYFPGGEISTLLKIRAADLVRITDATVAAVAA